MPRISLSTAMRAVGSTLLLFGCGEALGDPPAVEPIGEEAEAAELSFDSPPVAATKVYVDAQGTVELWVFGCQANRLKRNTALYADVPAWRGWQELGVGCRGRPSVVADNPSPGPSSVAVYVRRDDDQLWELWWPTATSASPMWGNVSTPAALGTISGSPTVVFAKHGLLDVSVVVRLARDNSLYTADYYDGVWHRNMVANGSGPIRSPNTLRALPSVFYGAGYLPSHLDYVYIGGRGLSTSDDTTGWVASRPMTARGSFQLTMNLGPISGTPGFQRFLPGQFDSAVVANRSGTIHYRTIPEISSTQTSWISMGCSAGGSPGPVNGSWGYVRSGAGKLMQYSASSCSEKNFVVLTAPATVNGHAFYQGPWAELFHYYNNAQQSMGISNL